MRILRSGGLSLSNLYEGLEVYNSTIVVKIRPQVRPIGFSQVRGSAHTQGFTVLIILYVYINHRTCVATGKQRVSL